MSVIEVDRLTKDYGFGRGVFDVSFKIEKGEVFGFLGPNGAGKSTTIRHLMGFSRPQKGSVKILGKESFTFYHKILSKVGYIPGEIALPQGLTGWEFIKMMQDMQGKRNDKYLNGLLERFELADSALKCETKRMSLGIKRKLAVVTAFMSDPDVLVLDEPTSGLDPVMQGVFVDYVKEEKERGKTILLSSHIFSEVDDTCDRIAIIKDGKIVSEFIANDLKHASDKFFEVKFSSPQETERFLSADGEFKVLDSSVENCFALVLVNDSRINEAIEFLSGFNVVELGNRKETLEDYFMKFYKEDAEFKGV